MVYAFAYFSKEVHMLVLLKQLHVAPGYPNAAGLVASMGNRVAMCIAKNGAAIKK